MIVFPQGLLGVFLSLSYPWSTFLEASNMILDLALSTNMYPNLLHTLACIKLHLVDFVAPKSAKDSIICRCIVWQNYMAGLLLPSAHTALSPTIATCWHHLYALLQQIMPPINEQETTLCKVNVLSNSWCHTSDHYRGDFSSYPCAV